MNLFKRKIIINPLRRQEENSGRRNFFRKVFAPLLGTVILSNIEDLSAIESKTGVIYVKRNGEVIENYSPQTSAPYLGEICIFPYNFAPCSMSDEWMFCNGQTLSINGNSALFAMLGTNYGGDGINNFCLPDLRGRTPVHFDSTSKYTYIGESSGKQNITLTQSQMPPHSHQVAVSDFTGNSTTPENCFLAASKSFTLNYCENADTNMNFQSIGFTGKSQPVNIQQPFLALSFCIAVAGMIASRN